MVDPLAISSGQLSPSQQAFVVGLLATGRYADATAMWTDALDLLAERERQRAETAQLTLLHDVLAREAEHTAEAEAPAVVDVDAVLGEIELLLSAQAPRAFRRAG